MGRPLSGPTCTHTYTKRGRGRTPRALLRYCNGITEPPPRCRALVAHWGQREKGLSVERKPTCRAKKKKGKPPEKKPSSSSFWDLVRSFFPRGVTMATALRRNSRHGVPLPYTVESFCWSAFQPSSPSPTFHSTPPSPLFCVIVI